MCILARQFGSATDLSENWQVVVYGTDCDADTDSPSDCLWLVPGTYEE